MPVEKYMRGTGLTKEARVRVRPSNPPTPEEIEAIRELSKRSAAASSLDGQVAAIESWAIDTLKAAGLPTNGQAAVDDVQSMPWYANEILCNLYTIRKVRERIAAGDASEVDYLAAECVHLGKRIYEIGFKQGWEAHTTAGLRTSEGGRTAVDKRFGPEDERQAKYAEVRRRVSAGQTTAEAAAEHGVDVRTIQRWIKKAEK